MLQTPNVMYSNDGFTLIEAMLAVAVLVITMLWSMQGLVSIKENNTNEVIRQEAIKLGQELLTDARMTPYGSLLLIDDTVVMNRQINSYDIAFNVDRVIETALAGTSLTVSYTIKWDNDGHSYTATTVVSDQ